MKRLTRAPNLITAQHWVNVLSTAGVPCQLHNRYLNGALGEIPADQCAPEIWIVDDRDEALALRHAGTGAQRAGVGCAAVALREVR